MTGRRRIAVVIPKYGLVGGAEGFVSALTERVAAVAPAYEFHVFANRWHVLSDRVTFHKVPILIFPKFLTTVSFAHFAARRMAATGVDLVHTHERIFSADIFTMHGIPHSTWIAEVRRKRPSLYDRATMKVERHLVEHPRCRLFLPVSQLAAEQFRRVYTHIGDDRIEIMHPGVDTTLYKPIADRRAREDLRRSYGIGVNETLFLFVSMNFEVKGLDRIMTALSHLRTGTGVQGWRLLVVGRGNVRKYRRRAEELGIKERVIFTGAVNREALIPLYKAADGYCMLSAFDTFGLVVLEAMAAALPV
ncbi:MAG: glycosyltransferase family 4 protein, partial [Syntrophales bacterium]|nr:glycosyltransferase family 4 protein [Syntrophales bacterium]